MHPLLLAFGSDWRRRLQCCERSDECSDERSDKRSESHKIGVSELELGRGLGEIAYNILTQQVRSSSPHLNVEGGRGAQVRARVFDAILGQIQAPRRKRQVSIKVWRWR